MKKTQKIHIAFVSNIILLFLFLGLAGWFLYKTHTTNKEFLEFKVRQMEFVEFVGSNLNRLYQSDIDMVHLIDENASIMTNAVDLVATLKDQQLEMEAEQERIILILEYLIEEVSKQQKRRNQNLLPLDL